MTDEPPRKRMVKPPTGGTEEGRGKPARLKTAKMRTPSSQAWLSRQVNDPFSAKARAHGYRSRAAYKLTEIDDKDKFLKPGQVVVDLGAAPGGWSQVAAKRMGAKGAVVAIDLLEMQALPGVDFIQGDFTRGSGLKALQAALGERRADVVLSDMAPNMSGISVSDQARSMELAEAARDFAVLHLKEEGVFLVKVFQGAGYDGFLKSLRAAFQKVAVRKPDASRDESAEQYLLARGLKSGAPPEL
jgi:23S rRNA (uridine2552-2'-O)-methyltransferase